MAGLQWPNPTSVERAIQLKNIVIRERERQFPPKFFSPVEFKAESLSCNPSPLQNYLHAPKI
jgi:hypothetical protein